MPPSRGTSGGTNSISRARRALPAFFAALALAGDTLVVWRLDRLGRSLRHLIDTVTALADRGVGFRSLQESIDTTTPEGRVVFHVFAALAEFERDLISERTQAGLAAARARKGGRPTVMTAEKLAVAREMYASREHTVAAIATVVGVSRASLYRAFARSPPPTATPPPTQADTDERVQHSTTAPTPASNEPSAARSTVKRRRAARARCSATAAPRGGQGPLAASNRLGRSAQRYRRPGTRMCPVRGARRADVPRHEFARQTQTGRRAHPHGPPLARPTVPGLRAPRGQPCVTLSGRTATKIHDDRRRPTQAEIDARRQTSPGESRGTD